MSRLRGALASLVLLLGACGGTGEAPTVQRYVVRGEVVALPAAADRAPEILLQHEAIDNFVGLDGQAAPMAAMTMPFPLAPEVSLRDVQLGDPVEVTLEVRWSGSPPYAVVSLRELPAGTVLNL